MPYSMSNMLNSGKNKSNKTTKSVNDSRTNGPDIDYFEEGQIFLLKNGNFVYIYSVDPATKIKQDESTRNVGYMITTKYSKEELTSSPYATVITSSRFSVIVNADRRDHIRMDKLYDMIATYHGKASQNKMRQISNMLSRQIDD